MQAAVLRALEFDRIREALAGLTLTSLGRARALAIEPAAELDEVQHRLRLTQDSVDYEDEGGGLSIDAPEDLPATLSVLEVEEQPLDPGQLLGLARFAESVDKVVRGVEQSEHAGAGLRAVGERASSFAGEVAAIRRAIHPSGDVSDDASPALRELRDRLRRQRAKLRSTLEGLTRGRDTAKYLQDQIVTDRNGRYVLVVRAEHREAIPGVVHGASASGASLYLEPLSTVELNNDIVAVAEREAAEVRRILLALTDAFRLRGDELAATLDVAGELDELHARARLAQLVDGARPALTSDGGVEFRGARHPLLMLRGTGLFSTDSTQTGTGLTPAGLSPFGSNLWKTDPSPSVIGTDLLVRPPTSALVISGPNTGGKTVALKAAGLLALMAQAGLFIPIDPGSQFTPFRSIFADIGDEQSISASLSTFSARVANIIAMDRALELPALVLLDEVGSGTDPAEGGALGTAVIEHFRQRGAIVIATTHDDALKSYAATTAGVTTAAFGFNPDTYAPTYRLVYGAPGRSLALEIAERLGMPASVIAAARAHRSGRESQLAAHLARVDQELAALERERQTLVAERDAQRGEAARLASREEQVRQREQAIKRRADDRLNERLRAARTQIDAVVADLKSKSASLAEQAERRAAAGRPSLTTGEIGGLRAQARAALSKVSQQLELSDPAAAEKAARFDAPPPTGQTVLVTTFGAEGIVRGTSGKDVDVEVRGKRLRVPLESLRRLSDGSAQGPRGAASGPGRAASHDSSVAPRAASELVVIGSTVDDALARAEKFLDDALLADERRLRVVHGHGTGRLRSSLRSFFKGHPLVASVAPAPANEGGDGATIVELKD